MNDKELSANIKAIIETHPEVAASVGDAVNTIVEVLPDVISKIMEILPEIIHAAREVETDEC